MPSAYEQLIPRLQRLGALQQAAGLLEWDQQVMMPSGGTPARSFQVSMLSAMAHEVLTAPETGKLLAEAEKAETDADRLAQLRETRWAYDRATAVPTKLVEDIARVSSEAFPVWVEARKRSDFARFRPHLEKLLELKRAYAAKIDASAPAYGVLFNDYEPWIPLDETRRNLTRLREGLRPLIAGAAARAVKAPTTFEGHWPADKQLALVQRVTAMLGFPAEHGRIDVSAHPFMSGNAYDTRITTRFDESDFVSGLLGAVHETGHALYQLGLPREEALFGTPITDARDLVVHESQSRLWENHVGRSLPFWEQVLPMVRDAFPGALPGVTAQDAMRAVNHVEPSLIRVEADELTYHMHIALRFEIEDGMVSGSVKVGEVPQVWNDLMEKYLGLRPSNDARGCLQDMHWSGAAFGYFPTYSLGSMLSAQLHAAYGREAGSGKRDPTDYAALRGWLHEKVHRHGKRYKTPELVQRATGSALTPDAFLAYAKQKFGSP